MKLFAHFIIFFALIEVGISLQTKQQYTVCVQESKCDKADIIDQHTCFCWTSQSIYFMKNNEEIKINTIDEYEDCYDGCRTTQTDAQLENYRCYIECMKGDDYESKKIVYEVIVSVVAGIILIIIGILIWRHCNGKEGTVIPQGQQPTGIIVQQQPVVLQQQVVPTVVPVQQMQLVQPVYPIAGQNQQNQAPQFNP